MADKTEIEWTDATWNPITGCTLVSEGCRNCYAAQLAATRLKNTPSRKGLARKNAVGEAKFTGEVRFNEQWLTQPLKWQKPRRIFVCAHGDLFHEDVPDDWIDKIFAVMAMCPQHTFQVLTKRPSRMRGYLCGDASRQRVAWCEALQVMNMYAPGWKDESIHGKNRSRVISVGQEWPPSNVWLGVSVEDQKTASERIPPLLETPAKIRFVSAEPLLGPIDLTHVDWEDADSVANVLQPDTWRQLWIDGWKCTEGCVATELDSFNDWYGKNFANEEDIPDTPGINKIDWLIVGGESGPGARPIDRDWVTSLRDDCAKAGTPFFFKQWGSWAPPENAQVFKGERQCAWWFAGSWSFDMIDMSDPEAFWDDTPDAYKVGKKIAGNTLEGFVHHAFPEVR